MPLKLTIITPESTFYDGEMDSVVAPGSIGYFGVLARHAPMIAAVGLGVLKLSTGTETSWYAVGDGVAEMHDNHLTILVDQIVAAPNEMEAERKSEDMQLNSPRA